MHQLLHQNGACLLSRIDARIKLLCALALLIMVLSAGGSLFPLATAGLCLVICRLRGISAKSLLIRFAEPGFIIIMIILVKLFFIGHDPLFTLHLPGLEITGYREGLLEGLEIAARITGAVAVMATLAFFTPFTELMAALAWLRVPKGFIDITLFAWRYLFLLFDDARVIYSAQKNRLGYSGFRRGLRSFGTLTGSLVIKAFDNSQNITTAMVQRGYDGAMPMLKHKPFRTVEVAAGFSFLMCMGMLWTF
ncbi:MAG: cobalt ECF transporter T component CbiQ [Geobacteraceae bacterium]|nr:cobalt ECF transporter T component CbiQ [Geobacteraceae bacterium]